MYVAIDLETTGLDLTSDQIIEIGAIKFDEENFYEEFSTLVNPNIQIPPEITRITGISQEDLRNAPQTHEIIDKLKDFIGDNALIVHNAAFDMEILKKKIFDVQNPYYDTYPLSQMLIYGMKSYSLESLAMAFNLVHEPKHRALGDAKATAELFRTILKEIKNLSPETLKKINELNSKTSWHEKNLFMNAKGSKGKKEAKPRLGGEEKPKTHMRSEKIFNALSESGSVIFENSPILNIEKCAYDTTVEYAEKTNEKVLIASSYPLEPTIKDKSQYLSISRLNGFLEKEKFTDAETIFAVKMLIFLEKTNSGAKQEITIVKEENSLWENVCCDDFSCDHDECFFAKALEKIENEKVIHISHKTLLADIQAEKKIIPHDIKKLILCDFDEIYENAPYALSLVFHSTGIKNLIENETLKVKTEMLFGMIWLLIEKYAETKEGAYNKNKFEENYKKTREWQQITGIALFIEEIMKKEKLSAFLKKLKILADFILEKTNEYEMWIDRDEGNEKIKITLIPKNIEEIVRKSVFENYKTLLLISPNISIESSFSYIKNKLKIDGAKEDFIYSEEKPKTDFYLIEDFRNLDKNTLYTATDNLIQYITTKNNGKTICVFLSRYALTKAFESLYEPLKKRGINVYAQEITGGKGKIIDFYGYSPETSVLFILEHYFKYLNLDEIDFNQLVFAKFFTNEAEKPREEIILSIKKNLNKTLARGIKKVFITDSYIFKFIDSLKKSIVGDVEIKSIKFKETTELF